MINIKLQNWFDLFPLIWCATMRGSSFLLSFTWHIMFVDEHIFSVCNPFSRANTYMEGYLVSPGYPNQYRNNLRCDFHLQAPREHQIHTRLVDMGLESLDGMACYDYLSMKKQGESDEDALYYCGNMSNVHAQTTLVFDHFVLIHFVTDDVNIDKGFMLHFQCKLFFIILDIIYSPIIIFSIFWILKQL